MRAPHHLGHAPNLRRQGACELVAGEIHHGDVREQTQLGGDRAGVDPPALVINEVDASGYRGQTRWQFDFDRARVYICA